MELKPLESHTRELTKALVRLVVLLLACFIICTMLPRAVWAKVKVIRGGGALSVSGTQLIDESGNAVRLQGVSTHGLGFGTDFTRYVNKAAFKRLRDDWGANVVRLPVYTMEYGGWCNGGDRDSLRKTIDKGVTYATELGMYVIIDWHILSDGNPKTHQAQAVSFFKEMSKRYRHHTNVIYEICNEPNGCSWSDIVSYAKKVIPKIRRYDSDAVIIVGTPTWSQDVDQVASSPLSYDNVMYALHFYAATHDDALRQKLKTAIKANTPVFISESSICEASGSGSVSYTSAKKWKSLIKKYGLSFVEWDLSNKSETASALKSTCSLTKGWHTWNLTATGRWYRHLMRELAGKSTKRVSKGTYTIVAACSSTDRVLTVKGNSKRGGTNVVISKNKELSGQLFKITYLGSGQYLIKGVGSGKMLELVGAKDANGANVRIATRNGLAKQRWRIINEGDGYYSIVSCSSGRYLCVADGRDKNGTNVYTWSSNGRKAQLFRLVKQ